MAEWNGQKKEYFIGNNHSTDGIIRLTKILFMQISSNRNTVREQLWTNV
jgi:hypothetical protein